MTYPAQFIDISTGKATTYLLPELFVDDRRGHLSMNFKTHKSKTFSAVWYKKESWLPITLGKLVVFDNDKFDLTLNNSGHIDLDLSDLGFKSCNSPSGYNGSSFTTMAKDHYILIEHNFDEGEPLCQTQRDENKLVSFDIYGKRQPINGDPFFNIAQELPNKGRLYNVISEDNYILVLQENRPNKYEITKFTVTIDDNLSIDESIKGKTTEDVKINNPNP